MTEDSTARRLPTPADLGDARAVVARYHPRTPLVYSPSLSRRAGREVYIKCENLNPVRSFKARGALYGIWRLSDAQKRAGVVASSTGNHGQGVAYAGGIFGVPVTVFVPHGVPAMKCDAIRAFGADLRYAGSTLVDAAREARRLADAKGRAYIVDGDDPTVMAGTATIAGEILEDLPDASTVVVPVGGGNLIAAVALGTKQANPAVRIVGVQSEAAPAAVRSWEAGHIVEVPAATFAEGIATSYPEPLAFAVIREYVDEMRLVSDDDLRRGIVTALETTGQLAEGAGAAPFAALDKFGGSWPMGKTVLILSGGNLPLGILRELLERRGP